MSFVARRSDVARAVARYGCAVLATALAALLRWELRPLLGSSLRFITFYPAVAVVAVLCGAGPATLAVVLGSLLAFWSIVRPSGAALATPAGAVVGTALFCLGSAIVIVAAERMRRAEQREVGEVHRELRATLEEMSDGFVALDREWRYVYVNPAAARIVGSTPEALLGRVVWEAFPELVGTPIDEHFHRCARENVPLSFESFSPERGRWYENRCHPAPEGLAVYFNDITERRAMRRDLEQAKAQAERASRAKDEFLAVLSHELRTPLTPVLGMVMMLERSAAPPLRDSLQKIRHNVELEAHLIDDLLDITRIARGKLELHRDPTDLRRIVQQAVEICRPEIEARRLSFSMEVEPAAAFPVDADATRLEQVFWNLIKNAVKFTPAGGRVRVVCRRAGGAAVVEVTDTGAGIEPDALTRIFNAFEQEGPSVTRRFGGLGLGLAISKALVEAHRGAIRASSEGKGKGATFEVTLPLSRPAPAAEAPAGAPGWEAPGREDASRPLRILLVEDDEDSQEMLRRVLETGGHDVQAAGDVSTALALADARAFDLVLSDLGLPDGSGIDLMRELRRRGKTMPAIALTGYGQEEDVRQSHEAGFSTHLTKPINLDRLGRAILDVDGARAGGGGREREAARRERRPRRAREAGMG